MIRPTPESIVWEARETTEQSHHVHGFCRTTKGTFLVFTEARIGKWDADPHHLILRRGPVEGLGDPLGRDPDAGEWGRRLGMEQPGGRLR